MILTRRQFAKMHNDYRKGLGAANSALWLPEDAVEASHFVCVRPITIERNEYWTWCNQHCRGQVRCYSSTGGKDHDDVQEEWWGFSEKDDILLWRLRWE